MAEPEARNPIPYTRILTPWPAWVEPLLLAAILALAASLRLYDLNRLPPGLWFDEGLAGLNALSLLHDGHFRLYFDNRAFFDGKASNAEEPLFHYLLALSIFLFGPTVLALRLVSAFVGLLTVGVFYGMVRTIWDRRTALFAALLLAVFRWHVHFSRTAFRTVLVPLFACLFFWLWWSGIERKRSWRLVLAGVVLGLGFYTYSAFQLLVPVWLCVWFARWLREKERRREIWGALLWPGLAALIVVLPLLGYLTAHPEVVTGRPHSLSIFTKAGGDFPILASNLWDNIRQFWWRGDHVAKHNVPLMAVFDPLTSVVFALGLLATLVGVRRDARNVLILLWAAWLACASVFSFGAPNLLRTLGMVPAVVLILANGYLLIGDRIRNRASPKTAAIALAVLIAWFGANEAYRYFVAWRHDPRVPPEFNTTHRQLADALKTWGGDVDVYIPGDYYGHCSLRYLLDGRRNVYELRMPDSLARQPDTTRDRVLVYSPMTFPRTDTGVDLLVIWFPRGDFLWRSSDGFLRAYRIAAADLMTPERAGQVIRGLPINPSR